MRVFVAGANGAVGRRLVPMLVAWGHQVTGTTTSERSSDAVRAMGAVAVVVDGLDAVGIGEAVARAEPDASARRGSVHEVARGTMLSRARAL